MAVINDSDSAPAWGSKIDMNLNLIADPWIRVRTRSGERTIRPHEIADPDILFPNWPRPDFNLNTLELLIGLVSLTMAPCDEEGWQEYQDGIDVDLLKTMLDALTPYFNLFGDGPFRFMQDMDDLDGSPENPVEALLIDAAGKKTAEKNADLMVHRERHGSFDLPTAAIALYTLQNSAPSGGAGHRTSLRGGGPMTTLVVPKEDPTLWDLVWANTPIESPCRSDEEIKAALPWCHPTATSEKGAGKTTFPPEGANHANYTAREAFFGMPRRIRLVREEGLVTGWMQKPWGTNYSHFVHPLSPYYENGKAKGNDEPPLLPLHPKPGTLSYQGWLGLSLRRSPGEGGQVARCVSEAAVKLDRPDASKRLLVAGWAMNNMTPVDFQWSEVPLYLTMMTSEAEAADRQAAARQMVEAARLASSFLGKRLGEAISTAIAPEKEGVFHDTQQAFEAALSRLAGDADPDTEKASWIKTISRATVKRFDAAVLPGMSLRDITHSSTRGDAKKAPFGSAEASAHARRDLRKDLQSKKMRDTLALTAEQMKTIWN